MRGKSGKGEGGNMRLILDPNRRSPEVLSFEESLRRKVVGQDRAVRQLARVYQVFRAGFSAPGRPLSNLLLLGPTGSGKTRLVEAAAETLLGNERAVLKIDCAEFQHSHEISKLIGSPPGYLGHRETHPLITQESLDQFQTETHKLSLVLFDEIEKASDSLWQLLLGILDKATLTLGDNQRVDFSRCMIFMTSNLGSHEITKLMEGGLGLPARRRNSIQSWISASIAQPRRRHAANSRRNSWTGLTKLLSSATFSANIWKGFWISSLSGCRSESCVRRGKSSLSFSARRLLAASCWKREPMQNSGLGI